MGNPFTAVTSVTPDGPGRYQGAIDPAWNLRPLPQGGIVTAIALRAMAAELADPAQRLRTLHTTYVAQVTDGPVAVAVDVLRRGRSMSHLRAEITNPGAKHGHVTTAVFGSSRRGFEFTDLEPPASVPPPDQCPSFRDPLPPEAEPFDPMPFWAERVEGRAVSGHAPWEDYVPDRIPTVTRGDPGAAQGFAGPPYGRPVLTGSTGFVVGHGLPRCLVSVRGRRRGACLVSLWHGACLVSLWLSDGPGVAACE